MPRVTLSVNIFFEPILSYGTILRGLLGLISSLAQYLITYDPLDLFKIILGLG